jgi:hypothetical protein
MATQYIPSRDADYATWSDNFSTLLTASPTTYGLIAGDATAVAAVNTAFQTAYVIAVNPATRTSVTIATKDAARAASEAVIRPYAVSISLNSGVDVGDKAAIGVTIRSTTPTPIPPPLTVPGLTLRLATPLQLTLGYVDTSLPDGKAKPFGAVGIEIWQSVGTVAATDPAQCSYVATFTKSPLKLDFTSLDRGKVVTLFGRWITRSGSNGRAFVGPWSASLVTNVI